MRGEALVITDRKFRCPHCKHDVDKVQLAIWVAMVCDELQYSDEIKIHVLRHNVQYAETVINILKRAFKLQEVSRKPAVAKNVKLDKEITVIEVMLEKVGAIRL